MTHSKGAQAKRDKNRSKNDVNQPAALPADGVAIPHTEPVQSPPADSDAEKPRPIWVEMFHLDASEDQRERVDDIIAREMRATFGAEPLATKFNVRLLMDSLSITSTDSDRIYRSFAKVDRTRPILLILKSGGGSISAAFFVAKVCRENTDKEFVVAVPREAKSAATLICCGADRIHMGSLSELGPIDPQFGAIPALALKHSVEHIAELAEEHPGAAGMLTDYLAKTLRIESLGYYERVAASAVQYAVRLLKSRSVDLAPAMDPDSLATRLVYAYKDHGFVIDSREAIEIFGGDVIACNTPEYDLANRIYSHVDFLNYIARQTVGRELCFAGAFDKCYSYKVDSGAASA